MRQALRVGLAYLVVSALWIYFSDAAVERFVLDPLLARRAQTWKGWAFVVASTALLVVLVRREVVRVRSAERTFRALVEQTLAGVYLIRGGRFLYVNPALAAVFGYDPKEMVASLGVEDVVAPGSRRTVRERLAEREEGGGVTSHYRFVGLRRDGSEVPVEVQGTRIAWEGRPAVLGVLLDVGERERLEGKLREAQKLEAVATLTGQVAHDFNNFLTAIVGPLDLCIERLVPGGEGHLEAVEARRAAVSAAALTRRLLTFSRRRPRSARPIDLNGALREMEPLLARLAGARTRLRLEPGPDPVGLHIDPSELEQVVANLVVNAGEAVDGAGTVVVRTGRLSGEKGVGGLDRPTAGEPAAARVWLEVEDDGPGIATEVVERLFDPFFTTKKTGTGLGLATVAGIARDAGGGVRVENAPGGGARFRVTFPEAEAVARADPAPGRRPTAGLGVRGAGTETVLVVEDEEAVMRTVCRALERFGYRVRRAATGAAAVREAERADPAIDLILCDVQLPDLSGPEVVRAVEERRPGARVLYMSGFSSDEVLAQLERDASARVLEKPFSVDELVSAVRGALDAGSGLRERLGEG